MTDNGDTHDHSDQPHSDPTSQEPERQDPADRNGQDETELASDDASAGDTQPARTRTRTRTRTRRASEDATDGQAGDAGAAVRDDMPTDDGDGTSTSQPGAASEADGSAGDDSSSDDGPAPETDSGGRQYTRRRAGRRRGSRGGRSRRGRSAGQQDASAGEAVPPEGAGTGDTDGGQRPESEGQAAQAEGQAAAAPRTGDGGAAEPEARAAPGEAPTQQGTATAASGEEERPRGRKKSSGRGGPRPLGGISEETRRAITEGPPRRMLVTVGEQRSQVAVLESRDLVEHYVTDRHDTSYVGNIYMGRVQNVLPGMEAAFVDIGKGRNGVLYAGEVDYDEGDLDGEVPRIEQSLEPGQAVLVQVTKDPMGTKGARLTQNLSIAGRYCVLTQGDGTFGISRKLADEERERLREILGEIRPEGHGLIVRTAAEGATRDQLANDIARIARIWERVEERRRDAKPLEPVYEEPDLVIRVIRDAFGPEYTDLVVDSADLGEQVRDYLTDVSPELVDRVSVHTGEVNLFDDYEVTNQIRRGLEKKVWLASGGYLIIEKTEAMWVIDVNTGKFVGESNLEETVLRNNLEAADEIARQLRLRDMGGIIVIDFVDMLVPANRDEVLKRFKRELARDKTKSRVMQISKLGLVEMTRKNVSQGLQESFTETCETCEGRGAVMVRNIVG